MPSDLAPENPPSKPTAVVADTETSKPVAVEVADESPGGMSLAPGFTLETDQQAGPVTPKRNRANVTSHVTTSNVVTPPSKVAAQHAASAATIVSPSTASFIKRETTALAMLDVTATSTPKNKKAKTKPQLKDLDFSSESSILTSYHLVMGSMAKASSDPAQNMTAIFLKYSVPDLTALSKAVLGKDWPKNQKKSSAVSIFAEAYVDYINAKSLPPSGTADASAMTTSSVPIPGEAMGVMVSTNIPPVRQLTTIPPSLGQFPSELTDLERYVLFRIGLIFCLS